MYKEITVRTHMRIEFDSGGKGWAGAFASWKAPHGTKGVLVVSTEAERTTEAKLELQSFRTYLGILSSFVRW